MGRNCNAGGRNDAFYQQLKDLLGYPGLIPSDPTQPKFETANCLDHCEAGPNLVVYPQGCWFHDLDAAALQTIIETYLQSS